MDSRGSPLPPDKSISPEDAWAGCPEASTYAPPGAEGVDAAFARFLGVFTAYVTIRSNSAWTLTPGRSQLEAYKPQHSGHYSSDPAVAYLRRTLTRLRTLHTAFHFPDGSVSMQCLSQADHWATGAFNALRKESLGSRALDPQFRAFLCDPHLSVLPALILHFQHLLSQALAAERAYRAQKWFDFVHSSFTTNPRPLYKWVRNGPSSPKSDRHRYGRYPRTRRSHPFT